MKIPMARFFVLGAFALATLSRPASASPPAPLPTPAPLPPLPSRFSYLPSARLNTSPTDVTVRANYDNPTRPVVLVAFPAARIVPLANIVEYHVYRNTILVGRFTHLDAVVRGNLFVFQDIGSASPINPVTNNTVPYVTVNIGDPSRLSDARSIGVPLFSSGVPLVYRITLLQAGQGAGGRPVYMESEIGRSNPVTPFH